MSVALRTQDVASIEKEAQCWYLEGGEANSANFGGSDHSTISAGYVLKILRIASESFATSIYRS